MFQSPFFLFGKHWGFCYFFDIEMDPNNFQHLFVTAASSTINPFIGYLFSSNSVEVSRLFDNFVSHFNEIHSNCFQAWTKRVASISSRINIYRFKKYEVILMKFTVRKKLEKTKKTSKLYRWEQIYSGEIIKISQ